MGAGFAPHTGLVFLHLVVACDAQVDLALAYKGGNVGGGEEDEGDGEVLDKGDVEAVLTAELDVGALEEVEGGLLEAALWGVGGSVSALACYEAWGAPPAFEEAQTYSWERRRAAGLLGFAQLLVGFAVSWLQGKKGCREELIGAEGQEEQDATHEIAKFMT